MPTVHARWALFDAYLEMEAPGITKVILESEELIAGLLPKTRRLGNGPLPEVLRAKFSEAIDTLTTGAVEETKDWCWRVYTRMQRFAGYTIDHDLKRALVVPSKRGEYSKWIRLRVKWGGTKGASRFNVLRSFFVGTSNPANEWRQLFHATLSQRERQLDAAPYVFTAREEADRLVEIAQMDELLLDLLKVASETNDPIEYFGPKELGALVGVCNKYAEKEYPDEHKHLRTLEELSLSRALDIAIERPEAYLPQFIPRLHLNFCETTELKTGQARVRWVVDQLVNRRIENLAQELLTDKFREYLINDEAIWERTLLLSDDVHPYTERMRERLLTILQTNVTNKIVLHNVYNLLLMLVPEQESDHHTRSVYMNKEYIASIWDSLVSVELSYANVRWTPLSRHIFDLT